MIVIVESGATKTDWTLVPSDGEVRRIRTAGMNLSLMGGEAVSSIVDEAALQFGGLSGEKVIFFIYAAGLVISGDGDVPSCAASLDGAVRRYFPEADIQYASDLLAAARAVCGHSAGIAAIMGTGSNSCLYDGEKIVKNVRSGGFILGDEGGGASLGKLFLSDYLKGLVPEKTAADFSDSFESDYATVVHGVYRGDNPSAYLGSFAPWIVSRCGKDEYITGLVEQNVRNFFTRSVLQYDTVRYSLGITGGFAVAVEPVIRSVAAQYGVRLSSVSASPSDGLVKYHRGQI